MRKIALLMALVLLFVGSLTGCGIDKNADNSYIISVYRELYSQDKSGKVVFEGYELKDSFYVLKTQMFELPYDTTEDGAEGKYSYSNLPSYVNIKGKKLQVMPSGNEQIYVRERNEKSISIYYEGEEISSKLSEELLESYNKTFKNTYKETFAFSSDFAKAIFDTPMTRISVELYTNESFSGEPFLKKTISFDSWYDYNRLEINLIKSTNVYIKVLDSSNPK